MDIISKETLLAKEPVFVNLFSDAEDVFAQFDAPDGANNRYQILYAEYEYECYSGSATVYGYDNAEDTFFEVHGSHCSCYGLEGQWSPEEIDPSVIQEYLRRGVSPVQNWVGSNYE